MEKEEAQTRLGINPEEVKKLATDPKNFTPKQWEFLQNAQTKLFKEKEGEAKRIESLKKNRKEELQDKKKKKPTGRKSGWMKS